MKIDVTAEDIDNGVPGECGRCPVALAIARKLGLVGAGIRVGPSAVRIRFDGARDLPAVARVFVEAFDWDRPVEPFSFEIEDA